MSEIQILPCLKCIKVSFSSITQTSNADVRFANNEWFAAVDLAMAVSGKNKDDAGKDVRCLNDDIFPMTNFRCMTLPGQGNANVRMVNIKNAVTLIMVLPGKAAKSLRAKFTEFINENYGNWCRLTGVSSQMTSAGSVMQVFHVFFSIVSSQLTGLFCRHPFFLLPLDRLAKPSSTHSLVIRKETTNSRVRTCSASGRPI
jgi:hypothetical protein